MKYPDPKTLISRPIVHLEYYMKKNAMKQAWYRRVQKSFVYQVHDSNLTKN